MYTMKNGKVPTGKIPVIGSWYTSRRRNSVKRNDENKCDMFYTIITEIDPDNIITTDINNKLIKGPRT